MARIYLFLIPVLLAVLQSCAEIQPLTGGAVDETAPKPVPGEQQPEQGATLFNGRSLEVTFDEYVKLNDPATTISMNPDAGKLTTELNKKTLTISWEKELMANTTYILQLNGAIRDLNEGNDSIMQFVFSTGALIDSLELHGRIANAQTNQAAAQLSVGLYLPESDPYKVKPVYATRSDAKGEFTFSYLKEGTFRVFAFADQNKDQLPQSTELAAFIMDPISTTDTLALELRAFPPVPKHDKLQVTLIPPGLAALHNRDSIDASKLTINGNPAQVVSRISGDSVLVALPKEQVVNYRFIYGNDTLRKPLTVVERSILLAVSPVRKSFTWRPGDSLTFQVNDLIETIDTARVYITTDKGKDVPYTLVQGANQFTLVPDSTIDQHYKLRFERDAVTGASSKSDTITFRYSTLLDADLSNLQLGCAEFEGQWIMELTQNDKVMYSVIKQPEDSVIHFRRIEPGQYGIRCTEDLNRNGKWDTGDYASAKQPETILRFTISQKLRANWDIEETLRRTPETAP